MTWRLTGAAIAVVFGLGCKKEPPPPGGRTFIAEVKGRNVKVDDIKAAVGQLDLAKLATLSDAALAALARSARVRLPEKTIVAHRACG